MEKPQIIDYQDLLSYKAVRYCETFFQYCRYIQLYFDDKLNETELEEFRKLRNLISACLQKYADYPSPYKEFYSRYLRMYNHYKCLETW